MDALSCSVEERPEATVVHVRGEVDIASAGTLRETLIEVLGAAPDTHLIVDLSGVEFIDSTGIGVVAGASKRANANSGRFTVVVTTPAVRRALDTTGLLRTWRVTSSVAEALNS